MRREEDVQNRARKNAQLAREAEKRSRETAFPSSRRARPLSGRSGQSEGGVRTSLARSNKTVVQYPQFDPNRNRLMFKLSLIFFVVAIIAWMFGYVKTAGALGSVAQILFSFS